MQTVPALFHERAQGQIVPIRWGVSVSFTKQFDDDVEFFTFDQSEFDGIDILAPSDDNPIQEWDYYVYTPYNDRVVSIEWTREIDFPYSVQSAIVDFKLNNYDDYFSPRSDSPIEEFILPARPFRIFMGFQGVSTIQQVVGLTDGMPLIEDGEKTATFTGLDWLSEIFKLPLNNTVAMNDVTTDVVLNAIFEQFGLTPAQYTLAQGRNKIPFVFFERGLNAGNVIRQLMQAEMGNLWIDEQGIIRFEHRLQSEELSVMVFDESNVINITTPGDDEIINTVRITSEIRDLQSFQPIWSKSESTGTSNLLVIPANGTLTVDADLEDPLLSAVEPTIGLASNVSWFTVAQSNGTPVGSNVSVISSELRTNEYTMVFENTNSFPVEITEAEVWGEPAKVVDRIEYSAYDEDSVAKYGEQVLEIDNDFFGNYSNCDSFAEFVLDSYKEYAGIVEIDVKGDPSLQLGDIFTLDLPRYQDEYKIVKMTNTLQGNEYACKIRARHYTIRDWFTFDVDEFDSPALLAP